MDVTELLGLAPNDKDADGDELPDEDPVAEGVDEQVGMTS